MRYTVQSAPTFLTTPSDPASSTNPQVLDGRDPPIDGADPASASGAPAGDGADDDSPFLTNGAVIRDEDGRLFYDPNVGSIHAPHPDNMVEPIKIPGHKKWHVITVGYRVGLFPIWGLAEPHTHAPGKGHISFHTWDEAFAYYRACYEAGEVRIVPRGVLSAAEERRQRRRQTPAGTPNDPIYVASSPITISSTSTTPARRTHPGGTITTPISISSNAASPDSLIGVQFKKHPTTQLTGAEGYRPFQKHDGVQAVGANPYQTLQASPTPQAASADSQRFGVPLRLHARACDFHGHESLSPPPLRQPAAQRTGADFYRPFETSPTPQPASVERHRFGVPLRLYDKEYSSSSPGLQSGHASQTTPTSASRIPSPNATPTPATRTYRSPFLASPEAASASSPHGPPPPIPFATKPTANRSLSSLPAPTSLSMMRVVDVSDEEDIPHPKKQKKSKKAAFAQPAQHNATPSPSGQGFQRNATPGPSRPPHAQNTHSSPRGQPFTAAKPRVSQREVDSDKYAFTDYDPEELDAVFRNLEKAGSS